jgi:hypothetical protein
MGPNEVGDFDAFCWLDCATARPLTPNVTAIRVMATKAELRKKARRLFLIFLLITTDILFPSN